MVVEAKWPQLAGTLVCEGTSCVNFYTFITDHVVFCFLASNAVLAVYIAIEDALKCRRMTMGQCPGR